MAAFETKPELEPGAKSAIAQNFIANVSKDSKVKGAEFDTFMFVDNTRSYTQPWIVTPEDYELKYATFNTSNMTGFIKKVSTDPYVKSAAPIQIGHISSHISMEPLYSLNTYINGT